MKQKIFSLAVIASFLFSLAAVAQPANYAERNNRKQMMMKQQQHWNEERESFFTGEQKEQVKQIRLETAKKVKPLRNELRELMAHQQTLTTAEKPDMKAIHANIEKISDVKTEMAKIHAAQHQEIRSLLTEEQLLKFDQRNHQRMGKKPGFRENNPRMPQRPGKGMNG